MTVVHEPRHQLLQFATHLAPLLGPTLGFCALLFGKLAMLGFSLRESRKSVLGPMASGPPLGNLQRPTGSLAGRWHGVPLRVLAPHRCPGQLGPNRHGIPFSRLVFVMLKSPPVMGFYYTPLQAAWLDGRDLVHGPRPQQTIQR